MRKINFVLLSVLLISIHSISQLNYFFSAENKTYVPVTGGTTPHLVSDYVGWEVEDEGFARVPIGFAFKYDGENYTKANVHVNGFITLRDSLNIFYNYPYFSNNLNRYPPYGKRPVIAAFWDDLLLTDTLNLVYKTTGHAPFRVFTVEWKKVKWVYESLAPVLSIELKLYETTNIIEFHYKDEGSLPDPRYAFASIGITSSYANRGFISLQSTSSNPSISLLRANDSLHVKPADKQVYRFTPAIADIPNPLESSIRYTNKTVSFDLDTESDDGHHRDNERNGHNEQNGHNGHDGHNRRNSYEYAITSSPIPPSSGRKTFSSDVTISALSPATTYYLYARSVERDQRYSQWTCDSFTTAINPVQLPYHLTANSSVYPFFPPDMRLQNFMDTFYHYSPNSDVDWNVLTDFPNVGDTSMYALNTLIGSDGDSWIFTPGLKLTAGKTYQLKFGYASFATQVPGEISSIEIKYGRETGAAAMTSGTLFKRTDIVTNLNEDGWINLEDTTIEIRPRHSGVYYLGFHNLTTLFNGQIGPVPVIGNISVTEKEETCSREMPLTLNGATNNTDNFLNWEVTEGDDESIYEVQSSTDGVNFKKIVSANSKTSGSRNNQKPKVSYRIVKTEAEQKLTGEKKGNSKNADQPDITNAGKGFEIQRSEDGVTFKKISAVKPITSKTSKRIKVQFTNYTDRKVMKGMIYYRLRQTAKNGTVKYSNIVTLETKGISINRIYPNPAVTALNVEVTSPDAGKVNLLITDINGKTMVNKPTQVSQGINNLRLEVGNLRAGSYIIKVICDNGCESAVKKFVKE